MGVLLKHLIIKIQVESKIQDPLAYYSITGKNIDLV